MIQPGVTSKKLQSIIKLLTCMKTPPCLSFCMVKCVRTACTKKSSNAYTGTSDKTSTRATQSKDSALSTDSNDTRGHKQDDNMAWEVLVDYDRLSPLELKIHERHKHAVKEGASFYIDPTTGYQVMTRLAHLQRGECCGNACRHCPYSQKNVPEEKKTKTFNSAFYT